MAAPLVLVLAITVAYAHYATVPAVAGAVRGMAPVSAGLIVATALKLLPALRGNAMPLPACVLFGALAFTAVGLLGWPVAWVMLGLGLLACAFAWWRIRRDARAPIEEEQR
jgi:chromate transporter